MDNCYQFNFQATLSWSEARTSCQQQGADLLSITKVEEQIFINGERWMDINMVAFMIWYAKGLKWKDSGKCSTNRTEIATLIFV